MNISFNANKNNGNFNSNNRGYNNMNLNNNTNPNNKNGMAMNYDNRGSIDTEDDDELNNGNVSFEKLIKDKPQPINVFDRESNPNRTSSLLGEDDIKRLNGYLDKNNKNLSVNDDSFIPSYYGESNNNNMKEENNIQSDIPFEFRNLETYRVIHNFAPHRFDELAVEKGHLLKLIKSFEDGWALCYNIDTNNKGFIPKNKLRLVEEPVMPINNCKNLLYYFFIY